MKNFLDRLNSHKIAPNCLACGSYFRGPCFFCMACFEKIKVKYQSFETSFECENALPVTSLFQWVANASDSLSMAIHLLKRPEAESAWKFFAREFANQLLNCEDLKFEKTILVPVPGSQSSSTHTLFFSAALAEILKLRSVFLLKHESNPQSSKLLELQQKQLSRQERLIRQIRICVDFTRAGELAGIQNIVLIDDVVTTGATLQACRREIKALKPSIKVSAWTMFKRL